MSDPQSSSHRAAEDPIRLFVSYAREDRKWLEPSYAYNLIPFLAESLPRQSVTFWFDNNLQPAGEYKRLSRPRFGIMSRTIPQT